MIEEEARRNCDIGFLESDDDVILTALNRDLTTALLSPEVSASPVAFEALHVLEYAAGRRRLCAASLALSNFVLRAVADGSLPSAPGGEYVLHFDADWENPRALTVLHYLEECGASWFPLAITDEGHEDGGWHPQTKEEAVAACEEGDGLDPRLD
eukprot:1422633-Prymnesium_polylepis.1